MITRTIILKAALTAALGLIGAQAQSQTVAFFRHPGNFLFSTPTRVPLNAVGAGQVTYTGGGRRTIIYTAECSHSGTAGWVTISISVDGVPLSPTGDNTGDAFCTGDGVSGHGNWVMATAMARTGNLADTTHTVRVEARLGGFLPNGQGSLGDSALAILR
jgi:hypothetical protein